jgi:hypothetical protein
MSYFVEDDDDDRVVIDIYDYNSESNNDEKPTYNNLVTFGADLLGYGVKKCVKSIQATLELAKDFSEYSFENMLKQFTRDQLDSIHFFAVHHDIPVKEAVRYKLVCHCCGNRLNQFGTDICSIRCADFLIRNKNNCIHGKRCVFCTKASVMLLNKESRDKAWEMTNDVLGICSQLVDLETGENGCIEQKV